MTLFKLDLRECAKGLTDFVFLKRLSVQSPKIVHAIDTRKQLLAMSTASKVQLVDLSSSNVNAGNEGVRIEASQEDLVGTSPVG